MGFGGRGDGSGNQWDDLPDLDLEDDGGGAPLDSGAGGGGGAFGDGFATHDFMDLKESLPQEEQENYEFLCRQHVNAFIVASRKYQNQSQLTQTVGLWRERIEPLLFEQERRPDFDIKQYGQKVLRQLNRKTLERRRSEQ